MVVALGVDVISREVLEKGAVLVGASQVLPCFLRCRRDLDHCATNLSKLAMISSIQDSNLGNSPKVVLGALVGALEVVALGDTIGCALVDVLDVEVLDFSSCRR